MNTTAWRWFPWAIIGALGFVVIINLGMAYDAFKTFPGVAGADGFDLSNHYNKVLASIQRQDALGWQVQAALTPDHIPLLTLTDHDGKPLASPEIVSHAERPLGPAHSTPLTFHAVGPGLYRADKSLTLGQWDIYLTVRTGKDRYITTRRVVAN